ncbi:MAG TPA: DUF1761 domain-containing protein [Chlamydiales bacterium]|nr:DUF1761 domain-containing protein [Chlamydiales bacterium]
MFPTDWPVVFIAALVSMGISTVWYSKWLFGAKKKRKAALFWEFLVALIIAYFLSFFEAHLGITDVTDGMVAGFFLWLGFAATTEISFVIWSQKTFQLFLIDSGCKLLSFLVMSGLIAA